MSNTPPSWGPWPPSQEKINKVMERAARSLAKQIEGAEWATGVVLLALPKSSQSLDSSFGPIKAGKEVCVGEIFAVGKHRSWIVYWDPAANTGRLRKMGHYDYRA